MIDLTEILLRRADEQCSTVAPECHDWQAIRVPKRNGPKKAPPCPCGKPHYAKGLCNACYHRDRYVGDRRSNRR